MNEHDQPEYRWQDSYVLQWVIEDVIRHIIRVKRSKKGIGNKENYNINRNDQFIKRKRFNHVYDRNTNKQQLMTVTPKTTQTNRAQEYFGSVNSNYSNKRPIANPNDFPPRLVQSASSKSRPAPRRPLSDSNKNNTSLNKISHSIEKRLIDARPSASQPSPISMNQREKRKTKPINYKRVNQKGFDESFVV